LLAELTMDDWCRRIGLSDPAISSHNNPVDTSNRVIAA